MFTKQHYEAVALTLQQSCDQARLLGKPTYDWWYDFVYTPMVRMFEKDNENFDPTKFAYVVAGGS